MNAPAPPAFKWEWNLNTIVVIVGFATGLIAWGGTLAQLKALTPLPELMTATIQRVAILESNAARGRADRMAADDQIRGDYLRLAQDNQKKLEAIQESLSLILQQQASNAAVDAAQQKQIDAIDARQRDMEKGK